jgi:hypothetical protein
MAFVYFPISSLATSFFSYNDIVLPFRTIAAFTLVSLIVFSKSHFLLWSNNQFGGDVSALEGTGNGNRGSEGRRRVVMGEFWPSGARVLITEDRLDDL